LLNDAEPFWITWQTAVAVHGMQLAERGGASGLRDRGLLESALAQPRQIFSYEPNAGLPRPSAADMCGVVRNHAFLDGNKRTGFVLGALFLGRNGNPLYAPQPEMANIILDVATGNLSGEQLTAWIGRWV